MLTQLKKGDVIINSEGNLHRLTDTDIMELNPEDIREILEGDENPVFEFDLNYGTDWLNLNKENFFNKFMKASPLTCSEFCEWIDEYKKQVNWVQLFGTETKFHHIPWEMQFGILVEFLSFKIGSCAFTLDGDWQEPEELVNKIVDDLIYMEIQRRNDLPF